MIDKLHYISQQPQGHTHLSAIKNALDAGCNWIQLRVKDEPAQSIFQYALQSKELCEKYKAKLIINDHAVIAAGVGAYGLHLGLQDMPIAHAREIVGKNTIIGGTANTFEHVKQRVAEGADYIGLGPYRFTRTKQNLSPVLGLEGYISIIKQVHSAGISIPIIAIGGIEVDDIPLIMDAGLYGVAVSGAITYAANSLQTVQHIYHQINTAVLKENLC